MSEGLAIESPTSTRLCRMILFRFCSYFCCLSTGDSYNFRLCFELQNVTPGQNNIAPTYSIVVRWGQNLVDCSYFFNFEGSIITAQIHWKILMVVSNILFLSCETACNRDVSVCLWHYASISIFSGVTLRDYICLLVQITNRWYVLNYYISNGLKRQSYSVLTQAQ